MAGKSKASKLGTSSVPDNPTGEVGLRSSFLESILLHLPHMVFVKEARELRFTLFNRAGEDLLGVKMSDLLGKNDYDFFPKEQADAFTAADRKVLEGKTTVVIEEEPIDSPGLGRRYLRTKKVPIMDADGQPLYLLGISEDITDARASRLLIEEQRHALANSSKLSALGEMAGGIAHEINNPLAIIIGLTGRLRIMNRRGNLTDDAVRETCDRIDSTVNRVSRVIKTMRAISRDGSQDPFELCNLVTLVQDTMAVSAEKFRFHGVDLQFDAAGATNVPVMGRATEIAQVLLNLMQNAFDAVADTSEKVVRIEICQKKVNGEQRVALRVSDSGIGVPESIRGKLMQPFFTTKPVGKGTGLGLSISRAIVERHGGQLRLVPEAGRTTFEADLPVTATAHRVA